jgi:hypothetical protein
LLAFLIVTAIASVFAALFIATAFAALTLLTPPLRTLARLRLFTADRPVAALLVAVAAFMLPTTIAVVACAFRTRSLCRDRTVCSRGGFRCRRCGGQSGLIAAKWTPAMASVSLRLPFAA